MASIVHSCPYCGYATESVNILPGFSDNPHCQRCGLTVREGDSKVDNELAALLSRQMIMGQNQDHHSELPIPSLSHPSKPADPTPINYSISQHYHHSSHQAFLNSQQQDDSRLSTQEDISPEEMLMRHSINPDALFSSQLALFRQADLEQRARLIELWQISPPAFQNSHLVQACQSSVTGPTNRTDPNDTMVGIQGEVLMDEDTPHANEFHGAEPYVVSGYESLAQREYDLSKIRQQPSISQENDPLQINDVYKPSVDPAYKKDDFWQTTQPLEHQYGAYQLKNYYIGCGVARAHWLEDQPMF